MDEQNNIGADSLEIDKLRATLQQLKRTNEHNLPQEVYDGIETAIAEYSKIQKEQKERKLEYGSNPLAYYKYADEKGTGLRRTSEYFDISNSETSNIDISTQYKIFAPQVVEQLKNGKVIALPKTWDLGAYYQGVTNDMLNLSEISSTRDIGGEDWKKLEGSQFDKAMDARLDYLANNMPSDKLYDSFKAENYGKYVDENKSNVAYLFDTVGKMMDNKTGKQSLKPTAESRTATAYNNLLSETTKRGRNIGGTTFFDSQGNPIQVEPYNTSPIQQMYSTDKKIMEKQQSAYNAGIEAAKKRPQKGLGDYFRMKAGKVTGKDTELYKYIEKGFYDQLSNEGIKIVRQSGTTAPTAVQKMNVKMGYDQSGNVGYFKDDNGEMTPLPQGMKEYTNNLDRMRMLTGDFYTAADQMGEWWTSI